MQRTILTIIAAAALAAVFSSPAFAWDCPSGQVHQQVPIGTANSVVVEGEAFVCVPSDPASSGNSNTNQNSNSNQNSSSSRATGGSVSGSGNSSSSSSLKNSGNSYAGVGNVSSSSAGGAGGQGGQGGAGGNATGGYSGVDGSGNSSQSQSSTSSASNNSNGNNSNNYSSVYRQAAQSAIAPVVIPSTPCVKGASGSGQGQSFGFGFAVNKVDGGCDAREFARIFSSNGSILAACKILVSQKRVKKAGITLADCMNRELPEPAPIALHASEPTPVVVNIPAQPAPEVRVVEIHDAPQQVAAPAVVPVVAAVPVARARTARKIEPCPATPAAK